MVLQRQSSSNVAALPLEAPAQWALEPAALSQLELLDPQGRSGLVRRVLTAFQTSSERLTQELAVARDNGDVASMRRVAHTLKSSSAIIGAARLSELCAAAENAVLRGDPELAPIFEPMQNGLRETLRVIAGMLKDET